MEDYDEFPNLDHWRSVMEFTVEQAALLLAMIDPLDVETLSNAKELNLSRWKKAWAHSIAIVSAIRQGVVSPVVCRAHVFEEGQWSGWSVVPMKPSDREMDISIAHTIITRASLINWITTERVQFTKPYQKQLEPIRHIPIPEPINFEPDPEPHQEPLTLPYYGHTSEGLEFVDDAIKQMWSTYDSDDPSTAPTQEDVIKYLREKGAGVNMADAVNLILRPARLRRGGQKTKKAPT